jgi:hypothetical protein
MAVEVAEIAVRLPILGKVSYWDQSLPHRRSIALISAGFLGSFLSIFRPENPNSMELEVKANGVISPWLETLLMFVDWSVPYADMFPS